jgi:hypothetical protein
MNLPDETRAILKKQLKQARARFDLEDGRDFLAAGISTERKIR